MINKTTVLLRIIFYISGIALLWLASWVIYAHSSRHQQDGDEKYKEYLRNHYVVMPPIIPDSVYFAGERIPVERQDIRESLDLELLKTPSGIPTLF